MAGFHLLGDPYFPYQGNGGWMEPEPEEEPEDEPEEGPAEPVVDSEEEQSDGDDADDSNAESEVINPSYIARVPPYRIALKNSLEPKQKKFMEQVLSLSITAPFVKSMAKLPKFSKDIMKNRKELEKASTVVLNELCSTTVVNGLQIKMGDPGQLNSPCEFGNSTSISALADSGLSINIMPYSFYKKLGLPRLQDTKMTLRMMDHTITNPHRIIEDLLVKVGNFVFPVYFLVLDMKEDEELPIILGRPFFSIARALVDIHDSKLTLRVEDEEITFEMSPKMINDKPRNEVSKMDDMEEDLDKLVEIEKMMEEELKFWEKPHVAIVKCSKPRASIPITFDMIVFTTPKGQLEEASDEVEDDLYEEVEIIDEDMGEECL
ncbi:uncharacterized protein LOC128127257 [Lactuca sativa]|uniref:uncharacterized protein LOC128127257 n=1 Tax=Lactuca sativa TaxID=4236 RepID=UPI0022AF475B|nr:uncharacterized protein LOC128127257 [Lactuca sativa]